MEFFIDIEVVSGGVRDVLLLHWDGLWGAIGSRVEVSEVIIFIII